MYGTCELLDGQELRVRVGVGRMVGLSCRSETAVIKL